MAPFVGRHQPGQPQHARRSAAVQQARDGAQTPNISTRSPSTGGASASSTRRSRARCCRRRATCTATRCRAGSTRTSSCRPGPWASPNRWADVCRVYAEVNQMFGDIVKVTPTSKSVGDMALFMVANNFTSEDILDGNARVGVSRIGDRPDLAARWASRRAAFRRRFAERILKDRKPFKGRPGASLPPADFEATAAELRGLLKREPTKREVVSSILYPKVFKEFAAHQQKFADVSHLPTPVFLLRHGAGRRDRRRHRRRQDADHQVPRDRHAASRRQADRLLRAERPAARRDGHRSLARDIGRDRA